MDEKAAQQNHKDAQYYTARLYAQLPGQNNNQNMCKESLYWYKRAADQQHILAQFKLARYYEASDCPEHSLEKAHQLFKEIAHNAGGSQRPDSDENYRRLICHTRAESAYHVAAHFAARGNYEEAVMYYQIALHADNTYEKANFALATLYMKGLGVEEIDKTKAKQLFLAAAVRGYAPAYTQLGHLAREKEQFEEALTYYSKAVQNDGEALYHRGYCYEQGQGIKQDISQACLLYADAARYGSVLAVERLTELAKKYGEAAYYLGRLSQTGSSMPRDNAVAAKWFKTALEFHFEKALEAMECLAKTSVEAQSLLGEMYYEGYGVHPNHAHALRLFLLAAQASDPIAVKRLREYAGGSLSVSLEAQLRLSDFCFSGIGVAQNAEEGVQWLRRAIDAQNSPEALYKLGCCYEEGIGLAADSAQALYWYKRALYARYPKAAERLLFLAQKENCAAQHILAEWFQADDNIAQALTWYYKAAQQLDPRAHYALARLIEDRPVSVYKSPQEILTNYEQALQWYKSAQECGYRGAEAQVSRIAQIIDQLKMLKQPDFQMVVFLKCREQWDKNLPADRLYWFAHILERVTLRCSEPIRDGVCQALHTLSEFPRRSVAARVIIKALVQLLDSEDFIKMPLNSALEAWRLSCSRKVLHRYLFNESKL